MPTTHRPTRPTLLLSLALILLLTLTLTRAPAAASARTDRPAVLPQPAAVWPVAPVSVLRGWEPPASLYGPGHRGVDLAAPPGTDVQAAAAGRVLFAGRVAGRGVVSIILANTGDPPLRITYEPVDPTVTKGDEVAPGETVARRSQTPSHCAQACLHWGLRRHRTYLNPVSLLPPHELTRPPPRLLPVFNVPLPP